jgi:hypothetical protein
LGIALDPDLDRRIAHIEGLTKPHLSLLAEMLQADGGKMFALDMLASAAIKRSMSLCAGFASLARQQNYQCAVSLLRLQLDSCLRFFAAFIVADPHSFAQEVLGGNAIRKMKDRDGALMTDKHLVETLGRTYSWIPRVYQATSGFIHLSDRHIFTVLRPSSRERSVSLSVSATDEDIPVQLWVEAADGFLAATDVLFEYLKGWTVTKQNPDLARQVREKLRG